MNYGRNIPREARAVRARPPAATGTAEAVDGLAASVTDGW
jgi:hypothetical protein